MAWNPSPEVQVARDAAKSMSIAAGVGPINRCVVFYTTETGKYGYASYGSTKSLCDQTVDWAEAMMNAGLDHMAEEW